jgi:hypothetical protein
MPIQEEMKLPALDRDGYADLGSNVPAGPAPRLPGEAGHEDYAADARRDHQRSVDLGESLKTDE